MSGICISVDHFSRETHGKLLPRKQVEVKEDIREAGYCDPDILMFFLRPEEVVWMAKTPITQHPASPLTGVSCGE